MYEIVLWTLASLSGQMLFYLCVVSHTVTGVHIVQHTCVLSLCLLYYVGSCDYTQVEKCLASKIRPLLPALLLLLLVFHIHVNIQDP